MSDPLPVLEYGTREPSGRRLLVQPPFSRVILEVLCISFVAVAIKSIPAWARYDDDENIRLVFLLIWLPATIAIIARFLKPSLRAKAKKNLVDRRMWRYAAFVSLAMLVWNLKYDVCPHASYWRIGPITWVNGNACFNQRNYRSVFVLLFEKNPQPA